MVSASSNSLGVGLPGRHQPKALGDKQSPVATSLVNDGRNDRLVLYLGAGVSIPMPSNGPKGNDIAERLLPVVADMLGTDEDGLKGLSLEELSGRVQDENQEMLGELKRKAAVAEDLRSMQPNFGHEALALLMREGMVRVVSANWDCAVETAGGKAGIAIEGVSRQADLNPPPEEVILLFKVHGCARRPETLVLTRAEVDEPELWARSNVQSALTGGSVVFVGLGTVGSYVSEPVGKLVPRWIEGVTSIRVVDPYGLSQAWTDALGDHGDDAEILLGSDEFLDDLLRATVSDALSGVKVAAAAIDRAEGKRWSQAIVAGTAELSSRLRERSADAVLRWWRDGVSASENGSRFICSPAGQRALMCVGLLSDQDGGSVRVEGQDENMTVADERRYFEIACRPGKHWHEARKDARDRVERRRRNGHYGLGAPVTVVIPDATGELPPVSAVTDIAKASPGGADIASESGEDITYVSAEDAVQGRLVL
jgi:hypothetical protein